jgi:hypothetical protein
MTKSPLLKPLERLVGSWTTEATHPAMPGVVVHGTVVVEWLEGEQFLLHRARTDHAGFPDALSVIGDDEQDRADDAAPARDHSEPRLSMHYFDSRGVFRLYQASADEQAWRFWRDSPGFEPGGAGRRDDAGQLTGR